jgi:hypothetical protein
MNTAFAKLLSAVIFFSVISVSFAGRSSDVKGYTKKDGTYVAPYKRSTPDKSKDNNWSSKGNTNPYTGKKGTVDPDKEKEKKK